MLTNNPLEILVKVSADTDGSRADLKTQIEKLSEQLKLDLGIKIDTKGLQDTQKGLEGIESATDDAKLKMEGLAEETRKAAQAQKQLEASGRQATDIIATNFGEATDRIKTSLEETLKEFKGQDFTVKANFDIEGGQNQLKGFQVDVKETEDSIKRITYTMREMGGDLVGFEASSFQRINKEAFDLSKNLNDATSKLSLLRQEGKISADSFTELTSKAESVGSSSGFKDLGNDIKQAVLDQKQLKEELRQQIELEGRLGESLRKRAELEAKDNTAQINAQNAAIDDQYKKYVSINEQLEKHVSMLRLTQDQADKMSSEISPSMTITSLKEQEKLMNNQVITNKKIKDDLIEEERVRERIRKLVNSITAEQGRNPKAFGNNAEVNEMVDTLSKIDPASKNAAGAVKGVSDGFDQLKASATTAGRESLGIMESFKIAMEKFPIWMAASTAFYGTVRTAREFMEIIVDIDDSMTDLRKVMASDTDFGAVFDRATLSAERFGQSISNVMDSYIEFAKQGYMEEELGYLADAAVIASNVGDITAQAASEYMTSAIVQWKLDAKDAMG